MVPGPTNVPSEVMQAMLHPIINHRSPAFTKMMNSMTNMGKNIFKTNGDIMVLTTSGTGAVEASVTNLLREGDSALVTVFGEFGDRLAQQIEDVGANAIRISADAGNAPTIEDVEQAFKKNKDIKALYVVSNETSTGVAPKWIKDAGEIASKNDAFYILDAISDFGGEHIPVDDYSIDICTTGSQKCLAAPPGLSILSISERAKRFMIENPPKRHYLNLPRYFKYAENGQTPFTPALPLYFALAKAFEIILNETMEKRVERHAICADAFYSGFSTMGLEFFAEDGVRSNTVIAMKYPDGIIDKEFRRILDIDYGVLIAGGFGQHAGKVFRVGSMGMINRHHVMATLSAIGNTLVRMGVKVNVEDSLSVASEKLNRITESSN